MLIESDITVSEEICRLALVGLAKNSGKTTTLNMLLDGLDRARRTVGVVSIGIDGEANDMLIGTRKPTIRVSAGDWIVTANDALKRSGTRIEFAESLNFSTQLGEVLVGRVLESGSVILAGMRHQRDLQQALRALERHGVELSIVDGAYGRLVAARPTLTDAVVVSTGAVLGSNVETIVEKTNYTLERLSLTAATASWQVELLDAARDYGGALLGGPDVQPRELPRRSALLGLRESQEPWGEDIHAIAVDGLVSDSVVEALLASGLGSSRGVGNAALLVPDGTVIQCRQRLFERLRRDWKVHVQRAIRLLGLSVNPTSVQGHHVEVGRLVQAFKRHWPELAVFDPLHSS